MSDYNTPKWIRFVYIGTSPSGKTKKWEVIAKEDETILGYITWAAVWKGYVFSATDEHIIFEKTCLRDIANFIEEQNNLHKNCMKGGESHSKEEKS